MVTEKLRCKANFFLFRCLFYCLLGVFVPCFVQLWRRICPIVTPKLKGMPHGWVRLLYCSTLTYILYIHFLLLQRLPVWVCSCTGSWSRRYEKGCDSLYLLPQIDDCHTPLSICFSRKNDFLLWLFVCHAVSRRSLQPLAFILSVWLLSWISWLRTQWVQSW